ncbi:MAG: hypothetical protein KC547_15030 [Anaerolineae bacterium]|nr:hypothetical protein [Anaerolineae bacterium]
MRLRLAPLIVLLIVLVAIDIALRAFSAVSPTQPTPSPPATFAPETTIQPQTIEIAYQCYERGVMIWRSDSGTIYVLDGLTGGRVFIFAGGTYADLPEAAGTPPSATLLLPQAGFGKVWANDLTVRSALGWAIEAERAYDSLITPYSNRIVIGVPGSTVEINYLGGYYRVLTPGNALDCSRP